MKKKVSLLLAFVLGVSPIITSFSCYNMTNKIYAKESEELTEDEFVKELEKELKFYFEDLGELRDGRYRIKDFYGLQREVDKGNTLAKLLFAEGTKRSWYSFGECIVRDQMGDLIRYMNAFERERINMAIKTKTWGTVALIIGGIVFRAAKKHGDKIAIKLLKKFSGIFLAASIAYSAFVCRNEL